MLIIDQAEKASGFYWCEFFFQLRWQTSARRARTRRCRCRTLGESGGSWWLKKSDTNTLSSKHLHFKATHDEVFDVHLTFLKRTVLMFCISFKYHLVESNWGIDAREMTSMPADYVDTSGIKVWTMARSFSCNRNIKTARLRLDSIENSQDL